LQGSVPPFAKENFLTTALILGLVSLIFIPVLIIGARQSFGKNQPIRITFTKEAINIHYHLDREESFPVANLEEVWLHPVPIKTRAKYGGAVVRSSTMIYELRIRLSDHREYHFQAPRLSMFGLTPEALLEIIEDFYI